MDKTYWNSCGTHNHLVDKLDELVPAMGSVTNPRTTNKKLERYRRASNCYYDLYNNGLWNRAEEFRRIFGFGVRHEVQYLERRRSGKYLYDSTVQRIEDVMDRIIMEAAVEQKLV